MGKNERVGFHLRFGNRQLLPELKELMKTVLRPKGVNQLILEIDKNFEFKSHPEVVDGKHPLTKEDARDLQRFARNIGIEVIPLFQCLGHQGWGGSRSGLLRAYPEFDETPDTPLDAEWPEIFCRSWCPQHPDVNTVVYALLDEMVDAFDASLFHIGMDEVYEIASEQCERCRGGERAELFAKAVKDMHAFLTEEKKVEVMMWGDRLIDANLFGYDNWEGDTFGTYNAIDLLPKDIIILDWHYDERKKGFPTPLHFMQHGFRVMPACWFKENVAEELFEQASKDAGTHELEQMLYGKLVTSWHHWDTEAFREFQNYSAGEHSDQETYRLFKTLDKIKTIS